MQITFRNTIQPEDVETVKNICLSTGFFRTDEVDVAAELAQEALDKGQAESGYYFIFAMEGEETCGYVCYGPTPCTVGTWDLYWIVVEERFRGKGLGKQLLEQTEQSLRQHQARKLYIETSSTEKYNSTRNFYQNAGYHEEARLKDFYLSGDDKVIYTRYL
ncbi:MAG: GNAT family N-acetyltransferase [Bacteroidota bacterium]